MRVFFQAATLFEASITHVHFVLTGLGGFWLRGPPQAARHAELGCLFTCYTLHCIYHSPLHVLLAQLRTVILINCGATVDVRSYLEWPEHVGVYVIDR